MKGGWLTLAALVAWTAALVLSGCAPLPEEPPTPEPDLTPIDGQAEFTRIAWEALGQTGTPPLIHWRRDLTCGTTGRQFLIESRGICADGTYQAPATFVTVAELPKARPWQFATCHEYQHFIDWRDHGTADEAHRGAAFQEGGAVHACELAQMAAGW